LGRYLETRPGGRGLRWWSDGGRIASQRCCPNNSLVKTWKKPILTLTTDRRSASPLSQSDSCSELVDHLFELSSLSWCLVGFRCPRSALIRPRALNTYWVPVPSQGVSRMASQQMTALGKHLRTRHSIIAAQPHRMPTVRGEVSRQT
jgi:hypothetical protein